MQEQISLVLTHFNRFPMLLECLAGIKDDARIGEIVISDDASTDGSWEKIQELAAAFSKIKAFRNVRNLDCYFNKAAAMRRATLEWAILFDSDNIMGPDYLDVLFNNLREWDPKIAYCPDFAKPHFDFRAFDGVVVGRCNVAMHMKRKHFGTMLNAANYFVNREEWLKVWDGSVDPHTADSMFQALNWLKSGNAMAVVSGLEYFHRVHDQSHYMLNVHKTGDFATFVEAELRGLN
jgi:glycosyltransferase involved in cell wall biosynthesis